MRLTNLPLDQIVMKLLCSFQGCHLKIVLSCRLVLLIVISFWGIGTLPYIMLPFGTWR